MRPARLAAALALVALAACSSEPARAPGPRVRLWHTFNPHETEALNQVLAGRERAGKGEVESTLLPFARGQTIIQQVLGSGVDCPDLVRVDATWLPGLARADLLAEVPGEAASAHQWLAEATELATDRGSRYGLPQSLDGLALIYRKSAIRAAGVAWPPETIGDLIATAHQLNREGQHGLGVRVDGYWFAAFLRAWGGDVLEPATGALGIDTPLAERALRQFADFFGPGGIAPTPPPSGNEAQDEARRFRTATLAVVVNGPWSIPDLGGDDREDLAVAPFPSDPRGRPAAPRGGHVLVVPRCARRPIEAWQLAIDLTDPAIQADWARRFAVVPTTVEGLAGAGRLSREFYQALQHARPLPRSPVTAEMFDDLNPAITAVVTGDATAAEALAGVARAWRRLLLRHGITASAPADDAGVAP